MNHFKNLKEKGQTSVEYIVLLAAVVAIAVTFFGKIRAQFSADPNACDNNPGLNVVCSITNVIGYEPGSGVNKDSFRSFRVL